MKTSNESLASDLLRTEENRIADESSNELTIKLKRFAFKVFFVFVLLFTVPTDVGFYVKFFYLDYSSITYRDLNAVFNFYNPQFFNHFSESGFFGLYSYINFVAVFVIALFGATLWSLIEKKPKNYDKLHYFASALARYRVAYGAIAWGYKKMFVMQMPPLNEAILYTDFHEFFAKRLYWEHISISPAYEVFLGFAEFIPGVLLLFRRTSFLGAVLAFAVLGNVTIANHAYDIGEQVPCASMTMLAFFLIAKDLPKVYRLFIKHENVDFTDFYPALSKFQNNARLALKYTFNFVFVFLFFVLEVKGFVTNDFYKIPNTPGLNGAKGHYQVLEFKKNGETVPYSPFDTIRWHDATFEKWSSLSYKSTVRPDQIEMFAAASYPRHGETYDNKWHFTPLGDERRYPLKSKSEKRNRDISIKWEFSGLSSDRKWFFYEADTTTKTLYLKNKKKDRSSQEMVLDYSFTNNSAELTGTNEFGDSIFVHLSKTLQKKPLLQSRNALKDDK